MCPKQLPTHLLPTNWTIIPKKYVFFKHLWVFWGMRKKNNQAPIKLFLTSLWNRKRFLHKSAEQYLQTFDCFTLTLPLSSLKENARALPCDPSSCPVLQLLKMFLGLFSAPAVGFHCTLLCRLFPSGFPGSELGMLWHSRSYEGAISQATWRREIALNSLNPLKLRGPYTHKAS